MKSALIQRLPDLQTLSPKDDCCSLPMPLMAGPCSAENEEQVQSIARQLHDMGVKCFRAGVWKPRTMPGGFEGHGERALIWLKNLKDQFPDLSLATEVATPKHVEKCLDSGIDILWIGARTSSNPFMVQEIAEVLKGVQIPIFVKNPVNPDLDLWIGAIMRLYQAGQRTLAAIHRGFTSYKNSVYRNAPHWSLVLEFRKRLPDIPLYGDPSHMAGQRKYIPELCQQFYKLHYDGLMVEVHTHPDSALSDASQQLTPSALRKLLNSLVEDVIDEGKHYLSSAREKIDHLDHSILELLAERMRLSSDIAALKVKNNLSIVQVERYEALIQDRLFYGRALGLKDFFIKSLFETIHDESIATQNLFAHHQNEDRKK